MDAPGIKPLAVWGVYIKLMGKGHHPPVVIGLWATLRDARYEPLREQKT